MGVLVRLASQWIAGENAEDALRVARAANRRGIEALINNLGEHVRDRRSVDSYAREYLRLGLSMQEIGIRGCLSVKPTQLGLLIDQGYALRQCLTLLDAARQAGRMLWLDMEEASTVEDTIWVYERMLERYPRVGLCLQANLRRTERDLARLLPQGARVRLTKGAYSESRRIAYTARPEIDRQFLRHLEMLFRESRDFAVASHDSRMIDRALALAEAHSVPFEFQMLQGVRDPLKERLVGRGHKVLEYIPYGPKWLPYFARRLRERPGSILTMLRSIVGE